MLPHDRAPSGPWLRTWLCALALAGGLLFGLEQLWRGHGHRPTVVDDEGLWAYHRARATGAGTVALLGDSRMLLDVDLAEMRNALPGTRVVQLAINGMAPMATLRDLAEDEAFAGTVVCSATPPDFERAQRDRQQGHVEHARHRATWNERLDRHLRALVQERLVVSNWNVKLLDVAVALLEGKRLPDPLHVVTRADRSRAADYTLLDLERHRARRIARRRDAYRRRPPPGPERWLAEAAEVAVWVERITARGGRVAFVRFPTSGEHWELDRRHYPRELYWDRLAAATGAVTLHFADVPALAAFDCPDTSHLDASDAPAFTRALVAALQGAGVLPGPGGDHAAAPR